MLVLVVVEVLRQHEVVDSALPRPAACAVHAATRVVRLHCLRALHGALQLDVHGCDMHDSILLPVACSTWCSAERVRSSSTSRLWLRTCGSAADAPARERGERRGRLHQQAEEAEREVVHGKNS